MVQNKNIAIISGANSGLGASFVKNLVANQEINEIWAIGRNNNRLNELVKNYGNKVKPLSLDLTDEQSFDQLSNMLKTQNVNVSFLINNAGIAKLGEFINTPIQTSLNTINLNISSLIKMTYLVIPYMSKNAHIINVSSQTSFQPLAYFNVYAATKAFITSFSRALNVELKQKQIHVTTVCPGWIQTPLLDQLKGKDHPFLSNIKAYHPDAVANRAISDALKNKTMSIYGAYIKFCYYATKITPNALVNAIWLKQYNKK